MNLDSVRELKQSLLKAQVQPLAAKPAKLAAMAAPARAVKEVDPIPRSVALGVAQGLGNDFKLAVRIQNRALEDAPALERIRKAAKGEVDERFIGRVVKRASSLQKRRRPLVIGCSIGHFRITAGTLGCFVTTKSGETRILSNNHVLADENLGKKGDAVIQPGQLDGGKRPADTVGALDRFVRLKKTTANLVDCALATIRDGIEIDETTLAGVGRLQGLSSVDVVKGTQVHKVGRTTGTTHGRVTAFELDNVVVTYDLGNLRFDDQIEIEGAGTKAFSDGGDSGSLIVDEDLQGLALLFAGGDVGGSNGKGLTYANPIGTVLSALKVDLLT